MLYCKTLKYQYFHNSEIFKIEFTNLISIKNNELKIRIRNNLIKVMYMNNCLALIY